MISSFQGHHANGRLEVLGGNESSAPRTGDDGRGVLWSYVQQSAKKIGVVRDVNLLGYFHTKSPEPSAHLRLTLLVQI